jgi:PBP1b-binding outer membrane lipoprotein LpoB
MMKYVLISLLAFFLCGCASTKPAFPAPNKVEVELQQAKYVVLNTRGSLQADPKNAEKQKAYDAAVADYMKKIAATQPVKDK